MTGASTNFYFLEPHAPQLTRLGSLAEGYFKHDPNTCIIKLRQYGEAMVKMAAANLNVLDEVEASQFEVLGLLRDDSRIKPSALNLFHQLRKSGNDAAHALKDDHGTALTNLKIAYKLAIWYHRSFGEGRDHKFKPFSPPPDPEKETDALKKELENLRKALNESQSAEEKAKAEAEQHAALRVSAEEQARQEAEDREQWETLAQEAEVKLSEHLATMQAAAQAQSKEEIEKTVETANLFAEEIDLDEADTRRLIDAQLRAAGWEADTTTLSFSNGVRPQKGKNIAIAEWPTSSGPADYVLFAGLKAIAVVEAKRKRKDVYGAIDQAKRYSRDYVIKGEEELVEGASWSDSDGHQYNVPFVFATNGRPYLKQIETKSGIWFCDLRRPQNLRRPLEDWYTPEGLLESLKQDFDAAHEKLRHEGFDYGITLRDYQQRAIQSVEGALEAGNRAFLLAMATGTGKTATCIALVYRLLKTKRFRRVLFLVDRSALGTQAADAFKTTRLEAFRTFAETYDLKELDDIAPDTDTRLHIATVQGMVKRLLFNEDDTAVPPVDRYDCIVVDECHRGYLLDRELGEAEIGFRNQMDYVSKYRRVLEHFDAVKIGLTATPALHTVEIFGDPIYQYTYPEAVIDGWLIDHEPPYRIITALSEDGIEWETGDDMEIVNTRTGQLDLIHLSDDIRMEIEDFNKKVMTRKFNRVVCEELARHIDPSLDEKTLIFCARDDHADIVVDELKKAFKDRYGTIDDDAVMKITGNSDRPQELIRRYKNEKQPNVAVTVDLMTTGIDVPEICNIVFIRRVNSRILYDQMIGRATRRCDDIGKDVFHIFDAVDLYPRLNGLTDMRPVAASARPSFTAILEAIERARSKTSDAKGKPKSGLAEPQSTYGDGGDAKTFLNQVKDEFLAKLRRKQRSLSGDDEKTIEQAFGMSADDVAASVRALSPEEAASFLIEKGDAVRLLDRLGAPSGDTYIAVSDHDDKFRRMERGYGDAEKPEDYLDGFKKFLDENMNAIPALIVVTQRPRELTRAQLKEIELKLSEAGYRETSLRAAWQDAKNQDIAASIIGFIRQAAVGDPLVPYSDRVKRAVDETLSGHDWTSAQRQWLVRIGQQLEQETVVDKEALDHGAFAAKGGFNRLNRIFDGRLETILEDLNEALWKEAG